MRTPNRLKCSFYLFSVNLTVFKLSARLREQSRLETVRFRARFDCLSCPAVCSIPFSASCSLLHTLHFHRPLLHTPLPLPFVIDSPSPNHAQRVDPPPRVDAATRARVRVRLYRIVLFWFRQRMVVSLTVSFLITLCPFPPSAPRRGTKSSRVLGYRGCQRGGVHCT